MPSVFSHAIAPVAIGGADVGGPARLTIWTLGAIFFAPFSDTRYFFPWRPIVVSPIGVGEFFGPRGLRVMWSELGWVWLPSAVVFLAGRLSKRAAVARH